WISEVIKQVRYAKRAICWEHACPRATAVGCAVDSALGVGARTAVVGGGPTTSSTTAPTALCRDQDGVRIARRDDHRADVLRLDKSHVRPRLSRISGLVHAFAWRERPPGQVAGAD